MKRLPPHIGWPLMVVGLLVMSIAAATITVVAAHSDGGAQVVDEYYTKATQWDEQVARQAASDALGWSTRLTVHTLDARGLRTADVLVTDRAGTPIEGLAGTLAVRRSPASDIVATIPLQPVAGQPGLYRQALPVAASGLWTFEVVARRAGDVYLTSMRHKVQ